MQARTPKDTGDYAWKAYQTYENGSVVEWTGPPDAGELASVVRVVPDTSQADDGDNAEGVGSQTGRDSGGGLTSIAAYSGLGLGALALIVVLLAMRQRR